MPDLNDQQKLAIINYVKEIEEKKEARMWGLIKNWSAILGVSALAILAGFASYLESQARDAARSQIDDLAQAGKIKDAILEAYKAISAARASSESLQTEASSYRDKSKELLAEVNQSLGVAQDLKKQFKSAGDIQAAVNALNQAKQGIVMAIKADSTILGPIIANVGVPSGAIAAFDLWGNCPKDWRQYDLAGGRFIVGAGNNENKDMNANDLSDYTPGAVGGEEEHILNQNEMPPHSHAVYQHAGYHWPDISEEAKSQPNQGAQDGDTTSYVHPGITSEVGGGQPHNTRPPYIALTYCIKQ